MPLRRPPHQPPDNGGRAPFGPTGVEQNKLGRLRAELARAEEERDGYARQLANAADERDAFTAHAPERRPHGVGRHHAKRPAAQADRAICCAASSPA
jgi:hypothetical protein